MDDVLRARYDRELDTLCEDLKKMMAQVSEIQKDEKKLNDGVLADRVTTAEKRARGAYEEMRRCTAIARTAQRELMLARAKGDKTQMDACTKVWVQSFNLQSQAEERARKAWGAFTEACKKEGFEDVKAYQAAVCPRPERDRIRQKLTSFRENYEKKLARAKELDQLLNGPYDEEDLAMLQAAAEGKQPEGSDGAEALC